MSETEAETGAAPTLRVYADYVCPFCYLGYASLSGYREERSEPLATDWHPFDLRASERRADGTIDHSVDDGKDEAYYEEAKKNVRRLAEEYDVEMAGELRKEIDSYDAQRVALRASEEHPAAFEAFHGAVFEALWQEDRDIDDPAVLADLAAETGLPDGFVAETLADDDSATRLEAAFEDAREFGVTGVPTFVHDEYAARGAVPPERLRRLVEGA
ncbi:disulfide bond formation protein DsbA [Halobacteriales archaeon QS_8_69_73]|nr:MAG: disulfide bond formation protein DsbA [Halobacteriales archaeon QS_8_69_73]